MSKIISTFELAFVLNPDEIVLLSNAMRNPGGAKDICTARPPNKPEALGVLYPSECLGVREAIIQNNRIGAGFTR